MRKARRPRSAGPCELPHPASRARRTGDGVHEKARRLMSAGQFFEFDWLSVLFRQVRNLLEKMGLGSSPRSLSPITGIWRPASPVECCWLSVSRRCAGLHERLQSLSSPQRDRPTASPPSTYRVRLLSPAFQRLPALVCQTWSKMLLRTSASLANSARSASVPGCKQPAPRIVCLAPRVLSLNPQVAFPFSLGRPRSFWSEPPNDRMLSCFRARHRPPGTFATDHSIRGVPFPLFSFRLRHRTDVAAFCSSKTAG